MPDAATTERIRILLELEQEAHDRAARQSAREIAKLERSYDPLSRATIRYQQEQQKLNKALESGTIDVKRHAELMDRVQAEYDQTTAKIEKTRQAMVAMASSSGGLVGTVNRNKAAFQQLGYQVGDFAVQVGGGTSAITAFTQQGSQLLGFLGPFGAIAGAALAVSLPLAAAFWSMGDASDDAADAIKDLGDEVSALEGDLTTIKGLQEDYARAVVAGQEAVATALYSEIEIRQKLMEIRRIEVEQTIAAARAKVEAGKEVIRGLQEEASFQSFDPRDEADTAYVRSAADAERLARAKELAEANADVLREIKKQALELELQEGILAQIDEAIRKSAAASAELATEEGRAAIEAENFRSTISVTDLSGITAQAAILGNLMGVAADEAMRYNSALNQSAGIPESSDGGLGFGLGSIEDQQNWVGFSNLGYGNLDNRPPRSRIDLRPTTTTTGRSGRSGGGGSRGGSGGGQSFDLFASAKKQAEALEQQIELIGETKARAAELTAQWGMLSKAKEEGIDLDKVQAETGKTVRQQIDEQAAAIGRLTDEYERAKSQESVFNQMQKDVEGLTESLLRTAAAGGDVRKVLYDFFMDQAIQAAAKALSQSIGGIFGGLGGGVGGIIGKRATGGPVQAGGAYLVNENTPNSELFVPSRSGAILNVSQAQAALRAPAQAVSQGGPAQVEVIGGDLTISDGGEIMTNVSVRVAQGSAQAVQTVKGNLAAWNQQTQLYGRPK